MANWTNEEMEAAYKQLVQKAVTDSEFRKELLANPNAAISKATGKEVPESFKIRIIEDDPAYAATYILPVAASEGLSDSALDEVAGGACGADNNCAAKACAAYVRK